MEVPNEIKQLVSRFEHHKSTYRSPSYKEARLRQDFLDPLFRALGWDVENSEGRSEIYRDVVIEESIKDEDAPKAPDYGFRIGGKRKFFLEAKKPSINLSKDPSPAYQLRRYSWSAKLPIGILTDFEEFAVYDCRIRPEKTDSARKARLFYINFKEYADRWDEIASLFSKDALLDGSFDRYVEEKVRSRRGGSEVDEEFLEEIELWRAILAENMIAHNPNLSRAELNYAVQMTIDRIIFLRICEDRGIEPYGRLLRLAESENIYHGLCEYYLDADDRYNSGLFHFRRERNRLEPPDGLTLNLAIPDEPLREIFSRLYYPDSPYEFSVFPIDILGQIYEQFLGKFITIDAGHNVAIEEKPEVKKAGGVYYTPTYVVDHVVEQSVGRLCQGCDPRDVADFRVLDPACGSGSFLLRAYQYLLNWHLEWYVEDGPQKWSKGKRQCIYQVSHTDWRLTTSEKKRILLNNIFGVDIDTQAVEVTKLSLLLAVLENENEQTISEMRRLFHERALPDLANNIKCGNSLVGPDFFDDTDIEDLSDEERRRVNPFDWEDEFPVTMNLGGFDAVIGNPPWVSLKGKFANDICSPEEFRYLTERFSGDTYRPNIYEYFIKQAIRLTKPSGIHSFIVPDRLGFNEQFKEFRDNLIKNGRILSLLYKADFPGVIADTLVYAYIPQGGPGEPWTQVGEFGGATIQIAQERFLDFQDSQLIPITPTIERLYFEMDEVEPLSSLASTHVGFIAKKDTISERKESERHIPILRGRNIFPFHTIGEAYFDFAKNNLAGGTQDPEKLGSEHKVLLRKTGYPLYSALDESGRFPEQSLYFIYNPREGYDLAYVLAVLNSKLFQYVYWHWMVTNRNSTPQLKKIHLDEFPIKLINSEREAELHNELARKARFMNELFSQLSTSRLPKQSSRLYRDIRTTDRYINQMVYELYALQGSDIDSIESNVGGIVSW